MKNLFALILILLIWSCSESNIIKTYFENGQIEKEYNSIKGVIEGEYREFYPDGSQKILKKFYKGQVIDTSIYFYRNPRGKKKFINIHYNNKIKQINYDTVGNVLKEGLVNSKGAIGEWKYYNRDGKLTSVKEFNTINGKEYLNQEIFLNSSGDTLYSPSHFFDIYTSKDTLEFGQPFNAVLKLQIPYYKKSNSDIYVVLADSDKSFDSDFSDELKVETDTFFSLKKDIRYRRLFPNQNFRRLAVFGKKFRTSGSKKVRGVLVEYYKKFEDSIGDSITIYNKKYFEKEVFVKKAESASNEIKI